MSSARKRAAIHRHRDDVRHAEMMRKHAESHAKLMEAFATVAVEQRDNMLRALILAEGIAQRVIAATGFDESQVSDWRQVVREAIDSAQGARPTAT